MRVSLALPAVLLVGALAAHGQEPMLISGDAAAYPVSVPVSTETATPAPTTPQAHWPAMPHYQGRGEWPGPRPCCPAPDGTVWGTCARPRTYVMHLWDDYCREKTMCPHCGDTLGSLTHYLHCKRKQNRCGTVHRGSRPCGCAAGGCASGGHVMTTPVKYQPAQPTPMPPTPMRDEPAMKKPPMMKEMGKKKAKMNKEMKGKPSAKKEKVEPKAKEMTSAVDGLPAFFAPLLNGTK